MRHEDVVKTNTLPQLARTLTEWHYTSVTDLIDEMEMWDLERRKQRLLVAIGKVVAQSKCVSHMGRKNGQKLASVLVPEKIS